MTVVGEGMNAPVESQGMAAPRRKGKRHDWVAVTGLVHLTEEQARSDWTRYRDRMERAFGIGVRYRVKYMLHGYVAQVRRPRRHRCPPTHH